MWSQRQITKFLLAVGIIYLTVLVAILVPIIFPIQVCVFIIARVCRPDLKFFVFGINTALTTDDPTGNAFNLINIAALDGQITCEEFRSKFEGRVLNLRDSGNNLVYHRLQETFTGFLGYSFWRDLSGKFDLRKHVRDYDYQGELALPSPCYEEDLLRINGPLLTVPWKKGQSPWELLVVQNFRERGSEMDQSVLILRNHHALMDGYSIVGLWQAFSGRDRIAMPRMRSQGGILKKLLHPLKAPCDAAETVMNAVEGQGCLQVKDEKRYFVTVASPEILVSSVKRIKRKYNVNYSAVLFSAFTTALMRVMDEAGKECPNDLASYMAGPKPNHPGGAVNHMVTLGVRWKGKASSPVERLIQTSKNIEALKSSALPLALDLFFFGFALLPRCFAKFLFTRFTLVGGAVLASSFPVSDDHFYLDDLKISTAFTSASKLGNNIGIIVVASGTAGRTRLVVTIDVRLLPQVDLQQKIGQYIKEEVDNLERDVD